MTANNTQKAIRVILEESGLKFSDEDVLWLEQMYEDIEGEIWDIEHCPACAGFITYHRCD